MAPTKSSRKSSRKSPRKSPRKSSRKASKRASVRLTSKCTPRTASTNRKVTAGGKATNAWIRHWQKFKRENPNVVDFMKQARKTYVPLCDKGQTTRRVKVSRKSSARKSSRKSSARK